MKKFITLLLFSLIFSLNLRAQSPTIALPAIPLDKNIKHGVLENGLNYFILHNEEPKGKVNFYIAQKVGSALEEPNQLGLAHFLEHMAFNGSIHFSGNGMEKYFQSKGLGGPTNLNAATSYDQTIYNINNVPSSDKNLMDSTLLALYDMSCGILLEESEINAERGVIREEMRSREDAQQRMLQAISPLIFPEYGYQHPIIGTEEVVMNFTPAEIRAYYKKWYRPDLQAIIIVGDINADEMEKKVVDLFSKVEMPENAAERIYPPFTPNKEPIYAHYSDPEMGFNIAMIMFKEEPVPFAERNNVQNYVTKIIPNEIISILINNRLQEFRLNPECLYSSAFVEFGDFIASKSASAFTIEVVTLKDITAATDQAMSVVARACKKGFTTTEYDRAKQEILSDLENRLKEKDKTNNNVLAMDIAAYFLYGEPNPGIENEYKLWQQGLSVLPLELINEIAEGLLTTENLVVVVAQPQQEGMEVVSEEVMIPIIQNSLTGEYEAYEEATVSESMISILPSPGKVNNKVEDEVYGSIYTLSNGAKVIVKQTDYAADEILFSAIRNFGYQNYDASIANDALIMGDVYDNAKLGEFDVNALNKYLSGKKVSLHLLMEPAKTTFSGQSTVKDFQTLMEMIYASFTSLQPDEAAYNSYANVQKARYAARENSPDYLLAVKQRDVMYGNNPFMALPSVKLYDEGNYLKSLDLVKNLLSNAADFTFFFVGNVDEQTIVPMLEQYIATLPSGPIKKAKVLTPIVLQKGLINKVYSQPMKTPVVIISDNYMGYNVPLNVKNFIMVNMAGSEVRSQFTATLREEEGGTYSPYALGHLDPQTKVWQIMTQVVTAPEKKDNILNRSDKEMKAFFKDGVDENAFLGAKETLMQRYKTREHTNSYLLNRMILQISYPDLPILTEYESALNSITYNEFNNFLKNLYNGKNRIQIVLEGTAE